MQWLFGLYREAALKQAAHVLGNPTDRSMGRLVGRLTLRAVPAPAHVTADIDTPEDLARWTR
jgi:molybdopterin-guanine dinucleotide biosynthesis protein A